MPTGSSETNWVPERSISGDNQLAAKPRPKLNLPKRLPERVVLLILGAVLNRMVAVLWIIAILSNITAIQRVVYTYVELKRGWRNVFTPRRPTPGGEGEEEA